jgi:hypothetical protein
MAPVRLEEDHGRIARGNHFLVRIDTPYQEALARDLAIESTLSDPETAMRGTSTSLTSPLAPRTGLPRSAL